MTRNRALSPVARRVMALLLDADGGWSHGYELSRLAGIKSGTLYPLLVRLEQQGWLEATWLEPANPGRPPRHAYRLTAKGRVWAANSIAPTERAALAPTEKLA